MRKVMLFLSVLIFAAGCGRVSEKQLVLATLNDYEITRDEFEKEYKESNFAMNDTPESRKEFLNNLINRKLILQDAQVKGLDKDKSFLKAIEKFWEQSLLKISLDKKSKEIVGSVLVSDREIEEAYKKMLVEGKTDRSYEQMYSQIKWEFTRAKGSQAMSEWVNQLHKKARIKINYSLLKSK